MDKDWSKWRMKQLPIGSTLINATIPLVGPTLPQLKTPQIIDDSDAGVTLNMLHSPHTSALVFLTFKALSINGLEMSAKSSGELRPSRATPHISSKAQWLNPSSISGESEGENIRHIQKNIYKDAGKVGVAEWLMHEFESNKDYGFNNNWTLSGTSLTHNFGTTFRSWVSIGLTGVVNAIPAGENADQRFDHCSFCGCATIRSTTYTPFSCRNHLFLIGPLVLDVRRVLSTAILIKKQALSRSSPFDLLIPQPFSLWQLG